MKPYICIDEVYDGPVLDFVGNFVQLLVHVHTRGVCVVAEAEADDAAFFAENGLVHVPGGMQVLEHYGAHGGGVGSEWCVCG